MFSGVQVGPIVNERGQDPGDQVGGIQYLLGRKPGKSGGQPDDAEQAGAGQGDQHRCDRVAEPAHNPHNGFHDAAEKIGRADPEQADLSGSDHVRIRGVSREKRNGKQVHQKAEHQTEYGDIGKRTMQNLAYAFRLLCPDILAGEADVGLMDRVGRHVDEVLDRGRRAASGHDDRAEGVDGGLNQHIGEREQCALDPGGQSDMQHAAQPHGLDIEFPQIQAARAICQA